MPLSDFRFRFLGTGTSAGVPAIGCRCDVCTSEDPCDDRTRTAAAMQWLDDEGQERTVLLDASPDLRQQAIREELDRCDAIFITHNHVDHIFGLDEVRRFNTLMQAPIDVHAEPRVLEDLSRVFRHIFESKDNINDSFVATLHSHAIEPQAAVEVHGLRVTPIRLLHGRLPMLGFRLEASEGEQPPCLPLAYCTDVSAVPPETWPMLEGLSTLVLDMLRPRHHPTHLNCDQAVEIADQVAADQTWFVHMSHDIGHREVDAALPSGMSLAFDGLCI